MPTNYICSVTSRFPENYRIGLEAGIWGVEEKYAGRIAAAVPGDLLVFAIGGEFRSIHRIESHPFHDSSPLWPEKDGSVFPHRIRISRALFVGSVEIRAIADRITFMRGKQWGGTLQGLNGVFNSRATDGDIALIEAAMQPSPVTSRYMERRQTRGDPAPQDSATLILGETRLRELLGDLMSRRGLQQLGDETAGLNAAVSVGSGVVAAVFGAELGSYTVVDLHVGPPPPHAVLDLLRRMSWIRQRMTRVREVGGMILCQELDPDLLDVTGEIPNINVHPFDVRLEIGGTGSATQKLSA